jgi:hypothetical protein
MTCALQVNRILDTLGADKVDIDPFLMYQELLKSAKCNEQGHPLPPNEVEKNMKALEELVQKEKLECKELFKF